MFYYHSLIISSNFLTTLSGLSGILIFFCTPRPPKSLPPAAPPPLIEEATPLADVAA